MVPVALILPFVSLAMSRIIRLLLACVVLVLVIPFSYGESELSDELIAATETEGKAAAGALHEYQLKVIEIKDKDVNLNDGTMYGGQYRYDLNAIKGRVDAAYARLVSKVRATTGSREDPQVKARLVVAHWCQELYGFCSVEELTQQISTRRKIAWAAVLLVCIIIGSIARRVGKPEDDNTPLTVPADLQKVVVPGVRYAVNLVTGLVMDKEMWDEIKTTTIYHHGTFGSYPTETLTDSVRKGKAFLLTKDGKEEVLNLVGRGHDYRPGNLMTFVFHGRGKKRSAVAAYNHATEVTEEMRGLDAAHGSHWILNLLATGVLGYYAFGWAAAPMSDLGFEQDGWTLIQAAGAALVFTAIVHFFNLWRRNRAFRKRYVRRLEAFLQGGENEIRAAFQ